MMLLDVLKTKIRFKKDKNHTRLSNHGLIVSWFHHSIPARSPSIAISQCGKLPFIFFFFFFFGYCVFKHAY